MTLIRIGRTLRIRLLLTPLCAAPAFAGPQLLGDQIHRLLPGGGSGFEPIATGDLDSDGDADLLIGGRVLLNDGQGFFQASPCAELGAVVRTIAVGDLDGDGDLDVIAGFPGQDELWLNDGLGCLTVVPGGLPPPREEDLTEFAALGDVDGDGDLDVVLANSGLDCDLGCEEGDQRLFLNDGHAGFLDGSVGIPDGPDDDSRAVALGDVDLDGDLDLFVMNSSQLGHFGLHRLLVNDGVGSFADDPSRIPHASGSVTTTAHFADLDQDGDLDLLIGPSVLWINDGTGTFVDASAQLPALPYGADRTALGDVDHDFDLDIVVTNAAGEDRLLLNDGSGGFSIAFGHFPTAELGSFAALAVDVDADRDLDFVLQRGGGAELVLGDGAGSFFDVPALLASSGAFTVALAVGDVDGDHDVDLLCGVFGRNELYLNDGSGAFVDASDRLPFDDAKSWGAALADVDLDGDLDALFGNGGDTNGEVERLYLNDGDAGFTDATGLWPTPADRTYCLATADVDRDGDLDVLAGNAGSPNRLYFANGPAGLTWMPGKWPAAAYPAYAAQFGDMDGDGDVDAVLGGGGAALFLNDGTGGFSEVAGALFQVNSITVGLALADVDLDGDLDVITGSNFANGGGTLLRMFLNDGHGVFADAGGQLPAFTHSISALCAADFDRDHDPDLAVFGTATALFLNDGSGVFSDAPGQVPTSVAFPMSLLAADTDDDGDTDLVVGGGFSRSHIFSNLSRQLAWRGLPRVGRPLELDVWGPPGAPFAVYGSMATTHVPFGPIGVLRLDRGQMFFRSSGVLDAQGRGSASYSVPDEPSLIGRSLYWQGLLQQPRRLTNLEIATFTGL